MTKKILFISVLIYCTSVSGQNDTKTEVKKADKMAATVQKVRGVPVFVMSEPNEAYDISGNVTDTDAVTWINAVNGEKTYRTIDESCKIIVDNAQRKQKKGKLEFDAIIISNDGHTGTCIKFKIEN